MTLYLLSLLFQENKSFGAITTCIHSLMYKKLCWEHVHGDVHEHLLNMFTYFVHVHVQVLVPVHARVHFHVHVH